jgi:hypothetical protein
MGKKSKFEYFKQIYNRYHKSTLRVKQIILNEFCKICRYNRKYAIRKLNGPHPEDTKQTKCPRKRKRIYSNTAITIIESVWEAAGYPWSQRLKIILREWMPWIKTHYPITKRLEKELLSISPRQLDRRLKTKRDKAKSRMYGRTKPGTLLRHQIPIRTDNFDVDRPGYAEIDTVSHSGNSAEGDFAYTVNQTDIQSTWTESRAVLGKGETAVVDALDEMRMNSPFPILAYDPDNGGEFINWHLVRYCKDHKIALTHSRPYKKDDQAHIEQKNWTHVRKLIGYDRYDSPQAIDAMNDLYKNELRLLMNLFMPSVKLLQRKRIGSKLIRKYDSPQTPFQRLLASRYADPLKIKELGALRHSMDPFILAKTINVKLNLIFRLANRKQIHKTRNYNGLSLIEKDSLRQLSKLFPGIKIYQNQLSKRLS